MSNTTITPSGAVKLGLIGTGKFAQEYYLPAFSNHKKAQITSIANRSKDKAFDIAEKYNISQVYTGNDGWEKLIEVSDVDAIIICTPNFLHAEIAIAALESGKHVLVEKPMAVSLEEANAMISAAATNEVILMVSFPQRFMAPMQECKRIIDSKLLGEILTIQSIFGHPGPEFWSPSSEWFFDPSRASGGALLDLGSHQVDYLSWLTNQRIKEVSAFTSTCKKGIKVEDNALLLARFEDGPIGSIYASWRINPKAENRCILYCENGILEINNNSQNPLNICATSEMGGVTKKEFDLEGISKISAFKKMLDHFIECVINQEQSSITGEDGYRSLEIILAAYESVRTKSVIAI